MDFSAIILLCMCITFVILYIILLIKNKIKLKNRKVFLRVEYDNNILYDGKIKSSEVSKYVNSDFYEFFKNFIINTKEDEFNFFLEVIIDNKIKKIIIKNL
jgi:hypothetical protein